MISAIDVSESLAPQEIIRRLGMERHPAAGWYSAHFADSEVWGRAQFTSHYHLLLGDEELPLRKTDAIVVWHFYLGAPVEVMVTNGGTVRQASMLGCDLSRGQSPQVAVPAYLWQSCRSLGDWTLMGCTMSPGYSSRTTLVLDAAP